LTLHDALPNYEDRDDGERGGGGKEGASYAVLPQGEGALPERLVPDRACGEADRGNDAEGGCDLGASSGEEPGDVVDAVQSGSEHVGALDGEEARDEGGECADDEGVLEHVGGQSAEDAVAVCVGQDGGEEHDRRDGERQAGQERHDRAP